MRSSKSNSYHLLQAFTLSCLFQTEQNRTVLLITTVLIILYRLPTCIVTYQGQSHSKAVTEEDLVHLCSTSFCRWKNYLMTKHFRLELNIGQEKPLPKIVEDKRGEDDLISETDPRDRFPITEAEKPQIE